MKRKLPKPSITVHAPARLHLGFVDLAGDSARRFGSLGLTLEEIFVRVHAQHAETDRVEGEQAERASRYVDILRDRLSLTAALQVTVERAIPQHAGLGSGTQLALAIGAAANELFDLGKSAAELATLLDRGARSGIGIGAFEQGGFLVDGGKSASDRPPPIVSRIAFPAAWRILLVFDSAREGLHGFAERDAFDKLPPFSGAAAEHLCRLVLMRVLPALVESDLPEFGAGIAEIQRIIGDHFAPAQGGRFTSPRIAEVLRWLQEAGVACVGQSSWGPTGFAVVDSDTVAYTLLRMLKSRRPGDSPVRFMVCRARNSGAETIFERGVSSALAR